MSDSIPKLPSSPSHSPGSSGLGDKNDDVVERRSLRDYYIILRERLWIALPAAILVAAGVGYVQARKPPMFASWATMQFEKPERIMTGVGITDTTINGDADLLTEVQILNSGVLRTKVYDYFSQRPEDMKILQRPFMKDMPPGSPPPNDQSILGNPSAAPVSRVYLVRISVTHKDPLAAALVANAYVDQYIQFKSDLLSGKNTSGVSDLKSLQAKLKQSLKELQDKGQKFAEENKLAGLDSNVNPNDALLRQIQGEIAMQNTVIGDLVGKLNQIDDYKKAGKDLLELTQIASFGNISVLKSNLDADTKQYGVLGETYGFAAPPIIAISRTMDVDKEALDQAKELAIENLRSSHSREVATMTRLKDRETKATSDSIAFRAKRDEFSGIQRDIDQAKSQLNDVESRLGLVTGLKDVEKIPLRPLDRAVPSGGPYEPNIQSIIKTCIGIGLLVFVGIAVGLSFVDDRIKSAWDVEHFVGVNLLGIIPDLSSLKDEDKYKLVLNNRQVPGMESFLSVYSSVKIHSKLDFPKVILVTSTIPGEGKTLISSNLAGSFARHGKKTLLIDCDLRRPMIHRNFKQPNTAGVITWYESGANIEGDLTKDPQLGIIKISEDMSLLCSGGRSKSPTEIFESDKFGKLISALKKYYDLVVIDSPPLGAVTDSLLIAETTDEVIYVCRFNRAYRKHIRLYIKALRSGKNEILGVVLNGLSPRRIEYYSNYRYYRSYKKYYGSQT